jgi:NAD(P)-dependent dehydrogenase (short-subunit alcohol dehydrogenase family)
VSKLATHEDVVVFAGARTPSTASQLNALAAKYPGKVHVVQLVASDESGNKAAIAQIKEIAGRLDVVIANTGRIFRLSAVPSQPDLDCIQGINESFTRSVDTPPETLRKHFEVNGSLTLPYSNLILSVLRYR